MSEPKAKKVGFGAAIGQRALQAVGENLESEASHPPRNELSQRGAALTRMAGDIVYSQDQWVDPILCRPSKVNARDYAALTYEDCADLIETIKSEGQQRTPATVRPTNDPDVPYEIVAGERRHWSISWLRANNFPEFRYLINVQKMDDETAFRFSDLENRARQDISDLERGRSYKEALVLYYNNEINRMVERIGISRRNLERYLELADLDPILVEAIGGHRVAKVSHAGDLKKAAKTPEAVELMLAEARKIASEQSARIGAGEGAFPAYEVIRRLTKAAAAKPTRFATHAAVQVPSKAGKPMLEIVTGTSRTAASIKLLPNAEATRGEIRASVLEALDRMFDAKKIPE